MRVLSVFDGMSCGMIAMLNSGVKVDEYIAYEIDKYAIQTSQHNFPMIQHMGDVFSADFTKYKGFDWLVGGSPCTHWSIAKTKNRETTASGLGWDLFNQYVRALKESKPKYFLYENNKSMSKEIRESISKTFGFEPILVNSALVSAQNRQRLYWVGIRQEDGTYKKSDISQPKDRGILLRDILESNFKSLSEKEMDYMVRNEERFNYGYIQKSYEDKSKCITSNISKGVPYNVLLDEVEPVNYCEDSGKSHTLKAQYYKNGTANFITNDGFDATAVAEPIRIPEYGQCEKSRPVEASYPSHAGCGEGSIEQRMYSDNPNKQQVDLIAEPVVVRPMNYELESVEDKDSGIIAILDMPGSHDILKRVYGENGKSPTVTTCAGGNTEPKVFSNIEEVSVNGKNYPVYKVENGMITVKSKEYPIKLKDGMYVIRKLTVRECMRLQTVPDWYEFPVSNSQAYKMLGNGWTCSVISHLISETLKNEI